MQKLFSSQEKKYLSPVNKSEEELEKFLCDNWKDLFPQYDFITRQFILKGAVHGSGSSGRIDILAYNPAQKRFVIFELKKGEDKYVWHQADNYRHYIKTKFDLVFNEAREKHNAELPKSTEVHKESEIVLLAKDFSPLLIEQAEEKDLTSLIKYCWFENDFIFLDCVTNAPDIKIIDGDSDDTEVCNGWVNRWVKAGWKHTISTIKPPLGEQLQDIPYQKENIDELEQLVKQVFGTHKRTALLKLLEKLKKGDTM